MLEFQRDIDMARVRRAHLLGRTAEMDRLLRDIAGKYRTDGDREYHYYMGLVLNEAGEYRRAVESFLKAIEIAPDYARARNSLGALYCRLNKYHFALAHFRKALEVNPYNPFLQYNIGSLYFEIGDTANARVHLENAIKYKANFGRAYHRLGVLAYQTQQYERAIEYMAKAVEFRAESHTTHYYTGMSYFNLENGSMALASLKKALKIKPDFFEAALDLARIHHSYGEFEGALEFYRKAFGAREVLRMPGPGGKVGHAEIEIGGAKIMMADEFPEMDCKGPKAYGGSPVSIHLYVPDVDSMAKQAVAAGAKLKRPVEDQFYGDRLGTLEDPFGHTWHVSTHKEDLSDDEIKAGVDYLVEQGR